MIMHSLLSMVFLGTIMPNQVMPMPSPDGAFIFTIAEEYVYDFGNMQAVMIYDSTGALVYHEHEPEFSCGNTLYWAWDDDNRVWLYCSDNMTTMYFQRERRSWYRYNTEHQRQDPNAPEPPMHLFPRYYLQAGGSTEYSDTLIAGWGHGWRFCFVCPHVPPGLDFFRDAVVERFTEWKAHFASSALESYRLYGMETGYSDWELEGRMYALPSPSGFAAYECLWSDYTGGAHCNEGSEYHLFGEEKGPDGTVCYRALSARDLLADSTELVRLSALVVDSLAKVLGPGADMDRIRSAARPEWANYADLMPIPDPLGGIAGFRINFQSYSVASYVDGPQSVFIPIRVLRP